MKIRPVVAEMLHADGHDETNSAFRNVANAPKNKRLNNFYWKFPQHKVHKNPFRRTHRLPARDSQVCERAYKKTLWTSVRVCGI